MGHHTFDPDGAKRLEDDSRYAYLSVDELLALFEPDPADVVADLGSGTGFYTRSIAPHVRRIVAADLQPAMHAAFAEFGIPENVDRVTAGAGRLPIRTDRLDAVYSTMTYHEFSGSNALAELARVLAPGGRLAIADWSAKGAGQRGPPVAQRFDAGTVVDQLRGAGFRIERAADRRETLVVAARLPATSRQS
ncbi:class I SAM-dependent methyltransferase [Halorhabdus sp. CUG00001]|uniref:class I SAM-dependent methyltransferase n=1 Tax=Halorhabdus sp. CUG00001 TaxID=2600297 RepID=UPI00131BDC92|nr:class I SAM-dependent methyltransferase [Halorhabdus sp. CUG00001]